MTAQSFERCLILFLLSACCWCAYEIWRIATPCDEVCCGTNSIAMEAAYDVDEPIETAAKRKVYKIWIAPGTVAGLAEWDFRERVMAGLNELSEFTNGDFVRVDKMAGSYCRIYPATDEMMRKKWRDPLGQNRVPLGLQSGNWMYLTTRNRWQGRNLEACVMHEMGHRVGIRHSADLKSIMHPHLPVKTLSDADRLAFQRKLGIR